MEKNPWTTLSSEVKYDNPWIKVTEYQVLNPSGGAGIYGVVGFKNLAIGILPLDEDLNTWLVGQYRYTLNEYSWEIPEGGGPEGSTPLESAQRELIEETGITAQKWTKILDMNTSNSVTDEVGVAYIAQDLSFGEAAPEDTEDLQVRKLPFQEVFEMAMRGDIQDGLSLVTIFKTKLLLDSGQLSSETKIGLQF